MTDMDHHAGERAELLAAAREAAMHAWTPYSRFRVGAAVAVETAEGRRIVSGANVENASYGLTLCAERAALAAACQLGVAGEPPRVIAVAVVGLDAQPGECMPCGACRQWLAELAPDAAYYVEGVEETLRLDDLLPRRFTLNR
ncbi:MAG TPA: cytidine deaminase [Ktedonobacterales bacterium]|nr:cytidine deaminase [Ktedonobacterales bacterium]